ncbi:MAG TPA: Lrp/AsnC family transcriptional regulator [Anaerolineales bacterium]|nr:Lrp/AsnC family transcriptional regulator [Anaerolineales bacterium]
MKLTSLDHQIIKLLNQDARISSARISRLLGIPERTIRLKVNQLIDHEIIKPVAVVNAAHFGYDLVVDIFCEVEITQRDSVLNALKKMPEISYIAFSTGEQDLSIQALFKSSASMHEFITHKLHQIPGIRRTRTVLVPQILKDTYQWLPPQEKVELP